MDWFEDGRLLFENRVAWLEDKGLFEDWRLEFVDGVAWRWMIGRIWNVWSRFAIDYYGLKKMEEWLRGNQHNEISLDLSSNWLSCRKYLKWLMC